MRPGDRGDDVGGIDVDDLLVLGILVGVVLDEGALGAAAHVLAALLVDLEQARLAAGLDGHVGNREAALDGERLDRGAGELHRAVERAIDADLADHVEDDVLGRGALGKLAVHHDADGLGHLEPGAAGGHAHAGVRGAHAGGEGTDAAVGAGVGVRADHEVAGHDDAALGEKGVLDAHAALLVVVRDPHLVGEVARDLGLLGALDVLVGSVVVGHEADLVAVEDAGTDLAHRLDGDGRGDVVGEHKVEVALDELAGNDLLETGVGGEDLLGHGLGTCHLLTLLR